MATTSPAGPSGLLAQLLTGAGLLNTEQAATHIGVTPHTLEVWRCAKRHEIPYIKVGRLVKYRREDLDAWLASRMVSCEIGGV